MCKCAIPLRCGLRFRAKTEENALKAALLRRDPRKAPNMVLRQKFVSRLQSDILSFLAVQTKPVPPKAIMAVLTDGRPTRSQRVALSKSLLRLCARGLVRAYTTEVCRPGNGYLYSICPPRQTDNTAKSQLLSRANRSPSNGYIIIIAGIAGSQRPLCIPSFLTRLVEGAEEKGMMTSSTFSPALIRSITVRGLPPSTPSPRRRR
jgi:hypothetical protein